MFCHVNTGRVQSGHQAGSLQSVVWHTVNNLHTWPFREMSVSFSQFSLHHLCVALCSFSTSLRIKAYPWNDKAVSRSICDAHQRSFCFSSLMKMLASAGFNTQLWILFWRQSLTVSRSIQRYSGITCSVKWKSSCVYSSLILMLSVYCSKTSISWDLFTPGLSKWGCYCRRYTVCGPASWSFLSCGVMCVRLFIYSTCR